MAHSDSNDLTHRIIGCAMTVHSSMGNGFQEVIYQRALAIEFEYQGISFEREKESRSLIEYLRLNWDSFFENRKIPVQLSFL